MKSEQAHTTTSQKELGKQGYNRRKFLSALGMSTAGAALLTSCQKSDWYIQNQNKDGATLDFKDDVGVLNYAYALEQLEAAFYIQVAANPASWIFRTIVYHLFRSKPYQCFGAKFTTIKVVLNRGFRSKVYQGC